MIFRGCMFYEELKFIAVLMRGYKILEKIFYRRFLFFKTYAYDCHKTSEI